jgi:HEAT repeat protein
MQAVTAGVDDEDYRVRRNAALALRCATGVTDDTLPALGRMLNDENRYNRFYAVDALRNLASVADGAQQMLLDHLFTSRWCPLTNKEDRF